MLVMEMKKEYLTLKTMIEKQLKNNVTDKQRAELERKLEKVDWAIAEMDRYKREMKEMEI